MGTCCKKRKKEELLLYKDNNNVQISESDFEIIKLIGKGSFGQVLLVRYKSNNKLYAMKILRKSLLKDKSQEIHTQTERNLMVNIKCPFIVDIKFAFQNDSKLFLVQEFMQGGDMFFHMHKYGKFKNDKVKFYISELVAAIECLHNNKMIYRDLKPENILMGADGHIKITDFGLSKILEPDEKTYTLCGTPQYVAPEIVIGGGHNASVDWWSLGVVMYEMLTGKQPFRGAANGIIKPEIYYKVLKYPKYIEEKAKDLISKLIEVEPTLRLGSGEDDAKSVKRHPFFEGINWDDVWNKKIEPPLIPELDNDTDLKYFDNTFTDEPVVNSNEVGSLYSNSDSGSYDYQGFTYVTGSVKKNLIHSNELLARNDKEDT